MRSFSKLCLAGFLAIAALGSTTALAVAPDALGGSAFPLTFISTNPINLVDGFNEMLQIVSAQTVNAASAVFTRPVAIAAGSALTLNPGYNNTTIELSSATGSTVTLPAATGSGNHFRFVSTAAAPSGSHVIKVPNATDFMIGSVHTIDSAVVTGYVAANSGTVATNSDTITLNATTTGGLSKGDWCDLEDIATATWSVRCNTTSSGTAATPFSAAQ